MTTETGVLRRPNNRSLSTSDSSIGSALPKDKIEKVVELYTLAARHGCIGNARFREDVAGQPIAALAASLPAEVVAAARQRGVQRDLFATVRELLNACPQLALPGVA
jgi:hypothetical protein